MAQTTYDADADEHPIHHASEHLPDDAELRQMTGINKEQESAIDSSADIAQRESNLVNPGGNSGSSTASSGELAAGEAAAAAGGEDGGFFRDEDSDKSSRQPTKKQSAGQRLKNSFVKRRKQAIIAGAAVSAVTLVIVLLSPLTSIFELDQMLNNIDVKTFSRFNASFSGRSNSYLKSYIRLRLMERDGTTNPMQDNLFFRSNKVDTGNPFYDWYRTMRTSKFEQDVFNKNGIKFTSMVDKNGNIRTAQITFGGDDSATFNPYKDAGLSHAEVDELASTGNLDIANKLGTNVDHFLDVQIFNSPKESRKAVNQVLKDNTHFFQVIKRRSLRKDIFNMTGISSWKFFEDSRTKITNAQLDIQRKIISKVFSSDTTTQNFIRCLFGAGRCPSTTDAANSENNAGATLTGDTVDNHGNDQTTTTGPDGKPLPPTTVDSGAVSGDVSSTIGAVAGDTTSTDSPIKDFIKKFVSKELGSQLSSSISPTKIWSVLQKLASADNFLSGGSSSKFSTLIKNAKRVQLMGVWTTYEIARDQIHAKGANLAEYGALIGTMKNFTNSESWQMINNSYASNTVSAASTTPSTSKQEYCSPSHQKTFNEFAWFCDDQKANDGGNATAISQAYSSTVGVLIHPIAVAVNTVNNSIVGSLFNWVNDVTNAITGPVINAIMSVTGLGNDIGSVVSYAVTQLLDFAGAGPMFDGTQPGVANLVMGGSAETAETSTRDSGGVRSTPTTMAYSNNLAASYMEQQQQSESFMARYASLSNPTSLLAISLDKVANLSVDKVASSLVGSIYGSFGGLFNATEAHSNAAISTTSYAQLAGVDTYDVPQQCMDLDPMDPAYLTKATNAWQMLGITPSYDLLSNSTNFWNAVYSKLSGQGKTGPDAQAIAEQVYNCGLLDQRVRGGLGNLFGYTNDGGYGS